MLTMIVATQIFVTKEVVLMHVDFHNVDPTLNVKVLFTQHNVYVYQVIREIPDLHVTYVSHFICTLLLNVKILSYPYSLLHDLKACFLYSWTTNRTCSISGLSSK